jgi:hypothetical protein
LIHLIDLNVDVVDLAVEFLIRTNNFPQQIKNPKMRKVILILIFLMSIVGILSAQTELQNKKVTIRKSKATVETILEKMTAQTGVNFSYSSRSINVEEKISFYVRRVTLEEALIELAKKIPVEYAWVENQVVLNRKRIPEIEIEEEETTYTISGFLNDQTSGETLIGASVYVPGTPKGTVTNGFGFYSLELPKGKYNLEYSYIGFESQKMAIEVKEHFKKNVSLGYTSLELPKVLVKNSRLAEFLNSNQMSAIGMKPVNLENLPEFAGEVGLIKSIQTLPGIKAHSDGSSFFFVRGGERDQNLIILDDAPIYNPSHLFGFYSVIIPDFTRDMKIFKGDVPVNLGDRLSSIVDIRTKDGNLNKFEFSGLWNPLISRLSLEGPIVKGKSSFFTSFRHSNFRWLYKNANPNGVLSFADINFKWNYRINNKNRLYFTLFFGNDLLSNNRGFLNLGGINWTNFTSTFRWNKVYSDKLFSNTVLYTGAYNYKLFIGNNKWNSVVGNLSLKSDYTYYKSPKATYKFGVELHSYYFNPGALDIDTLTQFFPAIQESSTRQSVLYFSGNYKLSDRWMFKAGVRLPTWKNFGPVEYYTFDENYSVRDTVLVKEPKSYNTYRNIDPRLSLKFKIDSSSSLKLSYGIYHQYMQLISNTSTPFTSLEVWLPSGPNIKPQRSSQVALGYRKYFEKPKVEFTAEGYYKKMTNQIDYKTHANTILNELIEGELRFGTIKAYGIEFLLKKDLGRLNGWMGYTYSRSIRQTPGVNGGRTYPAFQDRPHDFAIFMNYRLRKRVFFSANWTYSTGSAISTPTGFYTFNGNTVPIYDDKNNDRLPDYHRLDIAFKFILNKPQNKYKHSLIFSLYNAYAHQNPIAINFNKIENDDNNPIVRANLLGERNYISTQSELVRFMPSLTYKFKI